MVIKLASWTTSTENCLLIQLLFGKVRLSILMMIFIFHVLVFIEGRAFPGAPQDASSIENVQLWSVFGIPWSSAAEAHGPSAESHLERCLCKSFTQAVEPGWHCPAMGARTNKQIQGRNVTNHTHHEGTRSANCSSAASRVKDIWSIMTHIIFTSDMKIWCLLRNSPFCKIIVPCVKAKAVCWRWAERWPVQNRWVQKTVYLPIGSLWILGSVQNCLAWRETVGNPSFLRSRSRTKDHSKRVLGAPTSNGS